VTGRRQGRHRRARGALVGLVAAALLAPAVAGCGPASPTAVSSQGLTPQPDGWRGLPLARERQLPDVTLTATDGTPVPLRETFLGDPTLVFFGYTSCPDICPVHLATIASAMREARIGYDRVDVVFISVDPERDTPERIDEFLAYFDRRIVGLTGDRATIAEALAQLDLPDPVVEGADPRGGGDLIGHPAQVIGFDAQGRALRVWPFGARRSDWIVDLPRIVREWS
jgi:protein SCO1